MRNDKDFDWSDDNQDLIIPWQAATAVYRNAVGGIVIRQEAHDSQDEDQFVVIRPEQLPTLIAKLQKLGDEKL